MLIDRANGPSFPTSSSTASGRELQDERRAFQAAVAGDMWLLQLHQLKARAEGAGHLRREGRKDRGDVSRE
jgi:hypothetical protein|eukprot:evm.model.NODE_12792_length_12315_cov_31.308405.5